MDLKQYYTELREKRVELEKSHEDGVVYVTSLFYRERNSTPGRTLSATCQNAARVITDGTHREATEDEVEKFLEHQRRELEKNTRAEQEKKQTYVIVSGAQTPFKDPTQLHRPKVSSTKEVEPDNED